MNVEPGVGLVICAFSGVLVPPIKAMKCVQSQYWPGSVCVLQVVSTEGRLAAIHDVQVEFCHSLCPTMWFLSFGIPHVSQRWRCNDAEAWYIDSVYNAGLLAKPSCSVPKLQVFQHSA